MAFTDPAKELAETLAMLASDPDQAVSTKISGEARVESWTPAFFRILFEITNRIDLVSQKISELTMDEDLKDDALRSVGDIRRVFSDPNILSQRASQIRGRITGANATVLKMLSTMIRAKVSYPLLSEEDREEILAEVRTLRDWLSEVQSDEKDFVRQALIEGLDAFIFRLERLEWLGHGYVLDGLKRVIQAYLSVQGARYSDASGAELQDAILAKAQGSIVRVLKVFDLAKDNADRADWALRAYGAVAALADGSTTVTALLK